MPLVPVIPSLSFTLISWEQQLVSSCLFFTFFATYNCKLNTIFIQPINQWRPSECSRRSKNTTTEMKVKYKCHVQWHLKWKRKLSEKSALYTWIAPVVSPDTNSSVLSKDKQALFKKLFNDNNDNEFNSIAHFPGKVQMRFTMKAMRWNRTSACKGAYGSRFLSIYLTQTLS